MTNEDYKRKLAKWDSHLDYLNKRIGVITRAVRDAEITLDQRKLDLRKEQATLADESARYNKFQADHFRAINPHGYAIAAYDDPCVEGSCPHPQDEEGNCLIGADELKRLSQELAKGYEP